MLYYASMMHPHILFVYKQFPAPSVGHAGGESLFRLIKGLHQRGFRISLVAKITEEEKTHLPLIESLCEQVYTTPHFRSMPGPRMLSLPRSYLSLRRLTRQAIKEVKPDLLHIETTQTAVCLLGMHRPPASYRTQDVNWFLYEQRMTRSTGWRRLLLRAIRLVFKWLETLLCRSYELILAISKGDQRLLESNCVDKPVLLVPLGTPMPEHVQRTEINGVPTLLFVGDMSRNINVQGITWFLDYIWSSIVEKEPTTHLYIVGRKPPPELTERSGKNNVVVTGFVDDLAPWYQKTTVFISPLLVAGGLLQKILDAMWLGVPVVATSVCNHGLGAEPGVEIITADTEKEFVLAVVSLLQEKPRRQQLSTRGQTFVHDHYDVDPALDLWSDAIRKLLQ